MTAYDDAAAAAREPKSCRACGRLFAGPAAYRVHFEAGEGSRCLPDGAYGQLVQADGVWFTRGTSTASGNS